MVTPYLPDIIKDAVARVSAYFEAREEDEDPFAVFFEKGLHAQVSREIFKGSKLTDGTYMVWMEMPERITFGNWRIYGEADLELYVVTTTKNTYTQQEREDLSFKPRLIPIYERLMLEIKRDRWFQIGYGELNHTRILLPFWGLGAPNGTDKENALGKFVDAIRIRIPRLPIKKQNCNASRPYPVLS